MKIAVFSDIHGNYEALKVIIDDINSNKYDEVICLGDLIGLGPNSKECLDLLRKNNIPLILGNHELYCVLGPKINDMSEDEEEHHYWIESLLSKEDIDYLSKCKLSYEKSINNYKLLFEHFLLRDDKYPYLSLDIVRNGVVKDSYNEVDSDYIFVGHEHEAFECVNKNNKTLVCLGSSGCRKDDDTFYTIIEVDDKINVIKKHLKYDRKSFENKFRRIDYPNKEKINEIFFGVN